MIQKSSHSRGFWVPAQGGKSLKGQVGPMGASLSFKALGPVSAGEPGVPPSRVKELLPIPGHLLGQFQDLGQGHSEQEQLVSLAAGLWEEWAYFD